VRRRINEVLGQEVLSIHQCRKTGSFDQLAPGQSNWSLVPIFCSEGISMIPSNRRLNLFALICVIYFTVSGGAFGLEPLVGAVSPGAAILLIVLTPFVWCLPMALMVAELATLLPEEGGYYVWVKEALGNFWAVQDPWWTVGYSLVLMAMLPLVFVTYLDFFIRGAGATPAHPTLDPLSRWLIAVAIIFSATTVNLLGARDVGRLSKVSASLVVGSFVVLILAWLLRDAEAASLVGAQDRGSNHTNALLLGLSYIVFNYSGWDNVSTYAGEVDQPQRNYPRAIAAALIIVILGYLLPVDAGINVTTDPAVWTDGGWPVIAQLIGGRWLGGLIAVAGLISMWALVNAQLFYVSRLPFALARDGWLPIGLAKVSSDSASPKTAVLCCGCVAAGLAPFSLRRLAVIQCLHYAPALTLEFLALIIFRLRRPQVHRPFRAPEGWWGLSYVCLAPFAFAAVVLFATLRDWRSFPGQLLVFALVVARGAAFYFIQRKNKLPALVHEPSAKADAISDAPSMRAEAIAWRFLQKEDKNGGGQ
jgi:amino acid transporter